MTEPLDMELIQSHNQNLRAMLVETDDIGDWQARVRRAVHDTDALLAEVQRLQAELAQMTQAHNAVFDDWETASGEAARATQGERQRWLDAADRVLASFYAFYMNPRDRDIAREVWTNIRKQVGA
jgi:hypothetical protein